MGWIPPADIFPMTVILTNSGFEIQSYSLLNISGHHWQNRSSCLMVSTWIISIRAIQHGIDVASMWRLQNPPYWGSNFIKPFIIIGPSLLWSVKHLTLNVLMMTFPSDHSHIRSLSSLTSYGSDCVEIPNLHTE
jgi:hypothetical protein